MLAAGAHWIQDAPQGQVEGYVVLMAAHDAIEVQTEFCKVVVLGRQ